MQKYFAIRWGDADSPSNIKKLDMLYDQQKKVISYARKQRFPIVFVNYFSAGSTKTDLIEAATGDFVSIRNSREIRSRLSSYYPAVQFITKFTDDLFDKTANDQVKNLEKFFSKRGIKNLIIIGANGDICVRETISGALEKKYNVIAISNAIADLNYRDFIYPYDFEKYKKEYVRGEYLKQIIGLEDVEALDGHLKTLKISQNEE
jgi:nicotinamidase-related amidase